MPEAVGAAGVAAGASALAAGAAVDMLAASEAGATAGAEVPPPLKSVAYQPEPLS